MSPAILFAVASLVFAGLIDFVYKGFARVTRSRGLFLAGMGLVWGVSQTALFHWHGAPLSLDAATLGYGVTAGVMVTASNLLLIESMAHIDVSLGSTVYRLNTVFVVLLSCLLLGESLAPVKLAGVGLGVAAALLLYAPGTAPALRSRYALFAAMALLACVFRASYGVASKAGLLAGGDAATMMLISAACWVAGGLGYALLRERDRPRLDRSTVGYALLGGALAFGIVNTLIAALGRGEASVVVPIANLGFVIATGISVALGLERLNVRKLAAVVSAVLAVVVLSRLG